MQTDNHILISHVNAIKQHIISIKRLIDQLITISQNNNDNNVWKDVPTALNTPADDEYFTPTEKMSI